MEIRLLLYLNHPWATAVVNIYSSFISEYFFMPICSYWNLKRCSMTLYIIVDKVFCRSSFQNVFHHFENIIHILFIDTRKSQLFMCTCCILATNVFVMMTCIGIDIIAWFLKPITFYSIIFFEIFLWPIYISYICRKKNQNILWNRKS